VKWHSYCIGLLALTAVWACATSPKPELNAAQPVAPSPADGSVGWPPQSLKGLNEIVIRHIIYGDVYYYLPSPCCDIYNFLYDSDGNYLCAPDGGITGRGDGTCPRDFDISPIDGEEVANPFYEP